MATQVEGSVSNRRSRNSRYRMIIAPNVVNPDEDIFDNFWTTNTGWSVSEGVATGSTTTATLVKDAVLTSGDTYRCSYDLTVSGGSVKTVFGTQDGATRSASGSYTEDVVANGTDFAFDGVSSFSGTISNIQVRRVQRA